jgi:large subunit ribosomal protein L6
MLNLKMLVVKFCVRYFNMSRVAKNPIEIVDGVTVNVTDSLIEVKGKVGEITFNLPETVSLEVSDNIINVKYDEENQQSVALAGTTRAIVNNMVIGVSQGFEKKLELKGVGYRAKASGKLLELTLGFSHPVKYQLPEEVQVETPSQTEVVLKSHNKQILGQAAAEIRAFRPPEPYKGKGVRYSDENVRRKEAKKAAGA